MVLKKKESGTVSDSALKAEDGNLLDRLDKFNEVAVAEHNLAYAKQRAGITDVGDVFGDAKPREKVDTGPALGLDLKAYPVHLLIGLRAEIDAVLPAMKLSAMNLEEELMIQFHTARALQTATLAESMTEANKKAQVVNTTASTLQALIRMQSEFHTAERFKKIETILIECLRGFPEDLTHKFFEQYERDLGAMK